MERLEKIYSFYFNKDISFERLELIESDITKQKLGLTEENMNILHKILI
jgi:hypothetical protein